MNIVYSSGPYLINRVYENTFDVYYMQYDSANSMMISSSYRDPQRLVGNKLASYSKLDKATQDIKIRQESDAKLAELAQQLSSLSGNTLIVDGTKSNTITIKS